ncbi:MAG: hypothetical protein RR971_00825 [Alistipes sp.]
MALLLVGSATLLFSCKEELNEDTVAQDEAMMTEYSENLTVVKSQNGRKSYDFTTPLLEGYTLAKDPYREFRKGVNSYLQRGFARRGAGRCFVGGELRHLLH